MTEKTQTITYTVGNRYKKDSYHTIEPYSTFTRTCEVKEGEDWKEAAQKLQEEVHSLLGDSDYLESLKYAIKECEGVLRKYGRAMEKADEKYNEMKKFMVAQGLGDKMPNAPLLLRSANELIKRLRPSVDVEIIDTCDDDHDNYDCDYDDCDDDDLI